MPDRIPAGSYGDQMPTIAFGTHPETGRLFIQGDLNAGGTGARPAYDGESAMIIFAGRPRGTTRSRWWSRAPRPSASCATACARTPAAPGASAAASASSALYEFLAPAFITFSLERKVTPPWGLRGGRDGAVNGGRDHRARRSGAARAQGHPASDRGRRARAHHDRRGRRLRAAGRARSGGGAPRRARGLRERRGRAARLRRGRRPGPRARSMAIRAIRCGTLFDGTGARRRPPGGGRRRRRADHRGRPGRLHARSPPAPRSSTGATAS